MNRITRHGMRLAAALAAQLLLNPAQPYAQTPTPRDTGGIALAPEDAQLRRFYDLRNQRPAWTEANWSLADEILRGAGTEGLEPEEYRAAGGRDAVSRDRARTAAILAYARDLHLGRSALRNLDKDILLPNPSFDAAAALAAALDKGGLAQFLTGLPPVDVEYRQLRLTLARYRAIADRGGWIKLDAASSEEEIRARLEREYPSLAGREIAASLKLFQEWHGLETSGTLDRITLAAMNVSAPERVRQIAANMERWRWLPRPMESSRITVNVPAAMLTLLADGRTLLTSRVIVGRPATPTPILRADGVGVTVNPPWTVPRSIATREMLPKLKRNPAWLKSQNIILLDGPPGDPHGLKVNWRGLSAGNFPYRLQQLPGPDNSLGLIKLELPNRFDVYLHDTPGKAAFAAPRRALSHGCVRVERILSLAAHALSQDSIAAAIRISDAIAAGKTRTLPLAQTLPVYFLYMTAEANTLGEARFWSDLYNRDRRLLLKLQAPPELRLAAQNVKCPTG
ncbi:MAG TPA: L,D-transpeptidase family protein [Rhizomicrobium sp.]|nr:L,D-transpeptidase family protein [Rhizomicrobium sp.]